MLDLKMFLWCGVFANLVCDETNNYNLLYYFILAGLNQTFGMSYLLLWPKFPNSCIDLLETHMPNYNRWVVLI